MKDYAAFIKANKGRGWPETDFNQEDDHPAVMVSWEDAQDFCQWLTERDRKNGNLGEDEHYRLPTDHEWSCAVGIGKREIAEKRPEAKNMQISGACPWGKTFPPPKGAGNFFLHDAVSLFPQITMTPMGFGWLLILVT